jgi:hypothetical protein
MTLSSVFLSGKEFVSLSAVDEQAVRGLDVPSEAGSVRNIDGDALGSLAGFKTVKTLSALLRLSKRGIMSMSSRSLTSSNHDVTAT